MKTVTTQSNVLYETVGGSSPAAFVLQRAAGSRCEKGRIHVRAKGFGRYSKKRLSACAGVYIFTLMRGSEDYSSAARIYWNEIQLLVKTSEVS